MLDIEVLWQRSGLRGEGEYPERGEAEREVSIEIVRDRKAQTLKATLDEPSSRRRSVRRII